jgi:hypothetical protein
MVDASGLVHLKSDRFPTFCHAEKCGFWVAFTPYESLFIRKWLIASLGSKLRIAGNETS